MAIKLVFSLLQVSLFTAPIILILLLVSKLGYKKYSANIRLCLWVAVGLIMLCPLGVEKFFREVTRSFSTKPLFKADYFSVTKALTEVEQTITTGIFNHTAKTTTILNPYKIVTIVYFSIAVICISYYIIQHRFYTKKIHRRSSKVTDPVLLATLKELKTQLKIKRNISVIYSESVSSPLLIGLFKPTIALPKEANSKEIAPAIILHELIHYKRQDFWVQLLFLVVRSLYWINPLVYFMHKQVIEEIELACDTQIIKNFTQQERKEYCYTIVSYVNTNNHLLTTGFSGRNGTKKRMESILNHKNKRKGILIVLVVVAVSIFLGACVYGQKPQEENKYIGAMSWPADGGYIGTDFNGYLGHSGIDINGTGGEGTPVFASASGTVIKAEYNEIDYGNHIIIQHEDDVSTLYAHCADLHVNVGDQIEQEQLIATVGSTGNTVGTALHFEVRVSSSPTDPQSYFAEKPTYLNYVSNLND